MSPTLPMLTTDRSQKAAGRRLRIVQDGHRSARPRRRRQPHLIDHRDQHEIERAIEDARMWQGGSSQCCECPTRPGAGPGSRRHPGIAACSPEIAVYGQPRKSALTKESAQQSEIAGRIPSSMLTRRGRGRPRKTTRLRGGQPSS
eukprot:scaffold2292_cov55-Phaeocystis_antarctica.AAC.3